MHGTAGNSWSERLSGSKSTMYLMKRTNDDPEVDMKQMVMVMVIAVWVLLPTGVQAQEDWEQPGLWVTAGGGYGSSQTDCVRCSVSRHNSFGFLVAAGGSASKKIRFGVEGLGWIQSAADTSREYFGVMAFTQFFPFETVPVRRMDSGTCPTTGRSNWMSAQSAPVGVTTRPTMELHS